MISKIHIKRSIKPVLLALYSISSCTALQGSEPSIAAVPGQPFSTGTGPFGVSYSPDGKWLATGGYNDNQLSVFSVRGDGSLTEISGSPYIQIGGLEGVAYSPDNLFLAVVNYGVGTVIIFNVDQTTGALSNPQTFDSGGDGSPTTVVYSPNGAFLAVANSTGATIKMFTVNQATGELTAVGIYPTGGQFNGDTTDQIAFSPDGNFLAAVSEVASNGGVLVFSVNPSTGVLSNPQIFPVTGSNGMTALAYSPNGDFLAAVNATAVNTTNVVTIFSVDTVMGGLTLATQITTPNPVSTNDEQTVAFSPDSQFVVVGSALNNNMYVYSVDSQGQLTQFGDVLPTGDFPASAITFGPIGVDNVSFFSTANAGASSITSYAFTLPEPVGEITITAPANKSELFVGTTAVIQGSISAGNTITVSSSDFSIISVGEATVSGDTWTAEITLLELGSATITATTGSDGQASVTYQVIANPGFSSLIYQAINKKYFLGE